MENLYVKTDNGNIEIDKELIEKYNIKQGTISPFTRNRVVNKDGIYNNGDKIKIDIPISEMPEGEGLVNDEIIEFPEGEIYSTSEIIDISQGTDSSMEWVA